MTSGKSTRQADVAYLCHFRPEPEGSFTVTCPKLPLVVTHGETLEEARENLREAVELVLEANRALSEEELAGAEVIRERLIA